MTTSTDDDIIQINSPSTFTSLYTGAQIPNAVTINTGHGVSHVWTETANGFATTADLASEWQSAYQKMLAGQGAQLTAIQRLEGNAEAVLENTGLSKFSVSQQNAFRQDSQREFDAIAAAQQIAQKTLGIDPNAPLTVQTYLQLGQIIQDNSLLEELSVQGHGLNHPPSPSYDGFTQDFQNNTDNTTLFVGGGVDTYNRPVIAEFFDDNELSHLPFGFKTIDGAIYQMNQNGAVENTLAEAITLLNDSMYLRTYTSVDFLQTTSTAASDAASGALAYTVADTAYIAALTAQQNDPSTAAADISELVNADGSYDITTRGAGTFVGQTYASALLSYDNKGSIVSVKLFDGSGHVLARANSDSSFDVFNYSGGTIDGVAYASVGWAYTDTYVFSRTTYYDANGTAIGTLTPTANGGYSLTLNGALAQVKVVNADGSWDMHNYLNAAGTVDGVAYASSDGAYTAANVLGRTTFYDASGTAIGTQTPTANGGFSLTLNGALALVKTVNADGSWDMHNYLNAAGTVGGVAYASSDVAYTAANVLSRTTYYAANGTAIGTLTPSANGGFSLTLNGALAQVKTVNADGSWDMHNYRNAAGTVDGVAYTSSDVAYTAANVLSRTTYYAANGTAIGTLTRTANGGFSLTLNGALAQVKTVNADGSWDMHNYLNAAGTVDGVAYASIDMAYTAANVLSRATFYDANGTEIGTQTPTANGGFSLTLNGALALVKTVNVDGSYGILTYQAGGAAVENAFSAAGALLLNAVDDADGSGVLTLNAANETVDMGPGALSATASGDAFALHFHATETIAAAGLQGEAFAFHSASGSSPWAATLSGLTASDQFQFEASAFGASNAAIAWTDLLASAHYAGGAVTVADLSGDTVTFKDMTTSALAAMSTQFHFV